MTPAGWNIDDLALLGAAWMFGGVLISGLFGVLLGRWRGESAGVGGGLLLWGLGNLAVAAAVAAYTGIDSRVLMLPPSRCEPLPPIDALPQHRLFLRLEQPGQAPREVGLAPADGLCAEDRGDTPEPVRVRVDGLASSAPVIVGEHAGDDRPTAIIATWSVFGGFAVLMALVMRLSLGSVKAAARKRQRSAPLKPWRKPLARHCHQLGLLVFVAAFAVPPFLPGSETVALQFGFRAIGVAVGLWCLGGLVGATLSGGGAAVLLFFVAVLIGVAELIKRIG